MKALKVKCDFKLKKKKKGITRDVDSPNTWKNVVSKDNLTMG